MLIHNALITGSLLVNGTGYNTGSFSGSFTGAVAGTTATASYVEYNNVANKPALVSGSSQITYSGLTGIPSGIVSGSAQVAGFGIFATTGSNQFNGNQAITGSLTTTGTIVAQTLNVQQVTSSIVYSSGSNIFGNSLANTQQFTGSLQVSGSSHYLLGNVGIGTASPGSILQANFSNATTYSSGVTGNGLTLYNTSTTNNQYVGLYFLGEPASGNAGQATIYGITTGTGAMDLAFSTRGSSVLAERMRITSGGNIEIGTTGFSSPSGADRFIGVYGAQDSSLILQDAVQLWELYVNDDFYINRGSTNVLTALRSNGNVGIGTNGPSERLEILGPDGSGAAVRWRMAGGRKSGYLYSDSAGVAIYDTNLNDAGIYLAQNAQIDFRVSGSQRMIITSGGNVGIGTTSSNASSGYKMLRINGATTGGEIVLAGNEVEYGYIYANSGNFVIDALASQPMRFRTGAQNRMEISSAGKVEIGNALVSAEILKVIGPTGTDNYISVYSGAIHMFLDADATNSSGIVGTQSNHNLILRTNGTNKVWVTTGGAVLIGGTTGTYVDFDGSTTARFYGGSSTNTFGLGAASTIYYQGDSLRFYPTVDNSRALGLSSNRYTAVWAVNGTIQTSDEREKTEITPSDLGLDFITKLRPVSYKWKVGQNIETTETTIDEEGNEQTTTTVTPRAGLRTHYGLIAQEVKEILGDKDFGGYIHDQETDTKGLRYDQFVPLLIKSIQELKSELDTAKTEIQLLKQQ